GAESAAVHDERDVSLLEDVRGAVAHAGLRPRVRRARESERALVEVCRLLRVADPQLDALPPSPPHEVGGAHTPDLRAFPEQQNVPGRRRTRRSLTNALCRLRGSLVPDD